MEVRAVPAAEVFSNFDQSAHYGEGEDMRLIGGSVRFDTANRTVLTDVLPPIILISGEAAGAIHWLLEQLDREWRRAAPGARLACNDLLRLMFIHALRAYIADLPPMSGNWLAALSDPYVGKAFEAIHADPVRNWTLAELAKPAFQSRSTFASHFKATVGVSPIYYIARWRMRLAAARLRRGREPISSIAASLGYDSIARSAPPSGGLWAFLRRNIERTMKRVADDYSLSHLNRLIPCGLEVVSTFLNGEQCADVTEGIRYCVEAPCGFLS